jgi:hypothetical protein
MAGATDGQGGLRQLDRNGLVHVTPSGVATVTPIPGPTTSLELAAFGYGRTALLAARDIVIVSPEGRIVNRFTSAAYKRIQSFRAMTLSYSSSGVPASELAALRDGELAACSSGLALHGQATVMCVLTISRSGSSIHVIPAPNVINDNASLHCQIAVSAIGKVAIAREGVGESTNGYNEAIYVHRRRCGSSRQLLRENHDNVKGGRTDRREPHRGLLATRQLG